jgi:hypothetical protein
MLAILQQITGISPAKIDSQASGRTRQRSTVIASVETAPHRRQTASRGSRDRLVTGKPALLTVRCRPDVTESVTGTLELRKIVDTWVS